MKEHDEMPVTSDFLLDDDVETPVTENDFVDADLSVGALPDAVQYYLQAIGRTALLNAKREIELARKIEVLLLLESVRTKQAAAAEVLQAEAAQVDGQPVVDRQGDWISPEEIEKAAYQYVLNSRKAGHQHKRDGDQPFHAGDMIESFVMTPEKVEKMGLPDSTPIGWWVGYKIHDDDAWSKVKKGEVTGFSIHGRGKHKEANA
jgi:hypothetical protein